MNIKRFINRNNNLIWRIIAIIFAILFLTKLLNGYYEEKESQKREEVSLYTNNTKLEYVPVKTFSTESDSVKITMSSFVNYCNNRELDKAYGMLTKECKDAMFPTIEDFEKIYINKIYKINRTFDLEKWYEQGNVETYLLTLYGDILATGNTNNSTQEFCTFIKNERGIYKLNINNYIYGLNRNKSKTIKDITVKIEHVDIYDEYQQIRFTIKNNTNKNICLNGNKYNENIYLQSSSGKIYPSVNSEFDLQNIVLKANSEETFTVDFNIVYGSNNATYLVISDIIFDYENYLKTENKKTYDNRTSIKLEY